MRLDKWSSAFKRDFKREARGQHKNVLKEEFYACCQRQQYGGAQIISIFAAERSAARAYSFLSLNQGRLKPIAFIGRQVTDYQF
jgi:hypothetical protein